MIFALAANSGPENPGAWTPAIVIAIVGTIIAGINLGLGIYKQKRANKIGRAKFGYELTDTIFGDDKVRKLLDRLDHAKGLDYLVLAIEPVKESPNAFAPHNYSDNPLGEFDSLLHYFDRIEHAIRADLTTFDTVAMPIGYYVKILAPAKKTITAYVKKVRYTRALRFLDRFDVWSDSRK